MSKVTLIDVGSGLSSSIVNNINTNSALITSGIENTLSRDGTEPNQMLSNLDMNRLGTPATGATFAMKLEQ